MEEKADQSVVVAALHLKTAMLSVSWTIDDQTRVISYVKYCASTVRTQCVS